MNAREFLQRGTPRGQPRRRIRWRSLLLQHFFQWIRFHTLTLASRLPMCLRMVWIRQEIVDSDTPRTAPASA